MRVVYFLFVCIISLVIANTSNATNMNNTLTSNIPYSANVPLDDQLLILTDFGPIVAILYPDKAPKSIALFKHLIRSGYYNTSSFYRMENDYFVQGGDPTETGVGNAGVHFPDESQNGLTFTEGSLALAARPDKKDSTGSQFFVTLVNADWLNGKFTIIGKIYSGIGILKSFADKFDLNSKGIMSPTVPFEIYVLGDYIQKHPELKKYFIAGSGTDYSNSLLNGAVKDLLSEVNKTRNKKQPGNQPSTNTKDKKVSSADVKSADANATSKKTTDATKTSTDNASDSTKVAKNPAALDGKNTNNTTGDNQEVKKPVKKTNVKNQAEDDAANKEANMYNPYLHIHNKKAEDDKE